jgi:GT2 family glycosyltransferase/glycosyltransferase involved in cell wall biosynthesis
MNTFNALISQRIQAALACFDVSAAMPSAAPAKPCTIVVPIYNGAVQVRRCLTSLLRYIDAPHTILLADDCSPDLSLAAELQAFAGQHAHVHYLRRAENLGYLDNVNAALKATAGDVVLLNSDTEIGPEFLERLQRAAYCRAKVAAACPLSDNATLLSIADPAWLAQFSTAHIQAALAQSARAQFPSLPTVVGFCLYLRRDALAALGVFDRFFAPGYGEEDDFALRARAAGWELVAATDVFVRHAGGTSFGRDTKVLELQARHAARLAWRWPTHESDVRTWWRDWPLREQSERLRCLLNATERKRKPKILHVLHRLSRIGGTENVARSLVAALSGELEQTMVAIDPLPGAWCDAVESHLANGTRLLMFNSANVQAKQKIAGLPADLSDPALERSFARLLHGGGFDLVHIHHLAGWNSLLLPSIAQALGVPVVLGLHCHYSLCPDPEMMQFPRHTPCNKQSALGDAQCVSCIESRQATRLGVAKPPLERYLDARGAFWQHLIAACAALISPSNYLARRTTANFPDAKSKMHVIAHGLAADELRDARAAALQRRETRSLNVGFLGGDGPHKGYALLKEIARRTQHLPIEYAAFGVGKPDPDLAKNLVQHPAFAPMDRSSHLVKLDLILLPSMMPETFSLVLSEAQAYAIPVIASDQGAFIERIEHGVDGWRLPATDVGIDVAAWVALLADVSSDEGRAKLRLVRQTLLQKPLIKLENQVQAYRRIYQDLIRSRSAPKIAATSLSRDPASLRLQQTLPATPRLHPLEFVPARAARGLPQIIAIARDQWAQSQYRVHLPLAALAESGKIAPPAIWRSRHDALPQLQEILSLDPDAVAFLHGLDAAAFTLIEALNAQPKRPRLVFMLDDLIISEQAAPQASTRAALGKLLAQAIQMCDVCICTTEALANALATELNLAPEKLAVVANALPKFAWQQCSELRAAQSTTEARLRVLWAGAAQHQSDLDLLLPVVAASKLRYQWVFFGLCPTGLSRDPAIEFHPAVEFSDYSTKLASLHADIAVAPLLDTEFNRCKSPLKLLEYATLELPVVASNLIPYQAAPILHADNTEAWLAALRALEVSSYRAERALTLKGWAMENYCLSSELIQTAWLKSLFCN